jgi:NAD(P)-dependent dehydrogenase (short-subunit alcohol dehydrogenase family)
VFDLGGKVALVTGAGRGVGDGIAKALATAGAAIAVNDLDAERARRAANRLSEEGATVGDFAFDVTDGLAVAEGVGRVEQQLGPIDILVNNAGIPPTMSVAPFRRTRPDDWRPYVELNLFGALHCTAAVLDGMCDRGWGRIIQISSGAGRTGTALGISLYGASKSGIEGFIRHLSQEVAREGVTANTIALGLMDNIVDGEDDGALRALAAHIPVGRLGTPDDAGAAVVYVASDEAAWMTGQTIGLNGGQATS